MNITNQNFIEDNRNILKIIGKNIENSHSLFKSFFTEFKIELNENFSKLYDPLISNKITVNWENRLFYNNYDTELALIVYRILDTIKHDFNNKDIIDCEYFLLNKYLSINRKRTPVHGNFIKLIYYFYINYDTELRNYFLNLESSFDYSLNNFSKRTTIIYIILEIIGLFSFILFFGINIFFLINSNKYIFRNILFIFIDFTHKKNYSFNNKYYNLLIKKKISNYILLLNEFNPKNLEAVKNNSDNNNISDLKFLLNKQTSNDVIKDIIENKKIKKKDINKTKSNILNKQSNNKATLIKYNSNNDSLAVSNNNITSKLKILNEDINNLNLKNLNNISINNSKNNSSNIILNLTSLNTNNKSNKIKNNELKINKITIDKILFKTKITIFHTIKILIIIFIIFANLL